MATSKEFHDYIMDQLQRVGDVTTRRMMGEYCLYYRGRLAGLLCDNCLLLKKTPSSVALLPDAQEVLPYEGAVQKLLAVEDPEDTEAMARLLEAMYPELPEPKKK